MTELYKWQFVSFISRGLAMALGLVQSFFIVRILSVSEWGLVQIAVSVGGALGIYQHLGLASGSTREISSAKDDTEVFKVFLTATFVRYLINIPLALFLFFFAERLALQTYNESALILPLKLYAIVLLVQGVQSIFNSVIAGTKRFKMLFLYQVGIAALSLLIHIPLIYLYKINGFFYALLLFNLLSSILLGFIALKPLKAKFELPSREDFISLFKDLMSISLAIYVVKIVYTQWEKIGPIVLGLDINPEAVGLYAFALLFAKKIVNVSDAVTDVNLPVFSEKYVNDFEEFKTLFKDNFNKIFALILLCAGVATYWSYELVYLAVGDYRYFTSVRLIPVLVMAFVVYSLLNIIKSSILIPARMIKQMVISFLFMLGGTAGFYFLLKNTLGSIEAMSYGMLVGSLLCFVLVCLFIQKDLKFRFIFHDHILLATQIIFMVYSFVIANVWIKAALFIIYIIFYFWGLRVANFIESPRYYLNKFRKK